MLTPRLERNLAAVSKSGTLSPQTHSVGLDVEGDRTRERKRGKETGRESHPPSGRERAGPPPLGRGAWLHLQESEGKPRKCLGFRRQREGQGHSDNGLEDFPAGGNGVYGLGMQGSPLVGQERSIRPRTGIHTSEVKCIMLPPTIFI